MNEAVKQAWNELDLANRVLNSLEQHVQVARKEYRTAELRLTNMVARFGPQIIDGFSISIENGQLSVKEKEK